MKFLQKLKWFLAGAIALIASTGIAYSINITIPQSTQKGDIPIGNANGTYNAGHLVAGSNITIDTSTTGSILITGTGGSGTSYWQTTTNGIFNGPGTAGYLVGINSTTPTANLVVQGSSTAPGIPILTVASSSGASFLTVLANGMVGIGNSNPQYDLHIKSSSVNGTYLALENTNASGAAFAYMINNASAGLFFNTYGSSVAGTYFGGAANNAGAVLLQTSGASSFGLGTDVNTPFIIGTNNLERMRIIGTGLAGINSSTPAATLAVKGIASSTPPFIVSSSTNVILLQVAANGSTTLSSLGTGLVRSTSGSLYTDATTYLTSAITAVSGMSGPSIHVATTSDTNIVIGINTTTANTLTFVPNWTGSLAVGRGGTGTTTWQNGSIPFYNGTRLTENNPVFFWNNPNIFLGIGTSSPWATLTVQGTATNTLANYLFDVASSTGVSALMVANNNRVGIGTTTPGQPLVVVGSTTLTSLGAGCVNSTATGGLFVAACGGGISGGTPGFAAIFTSASAVAKGIIMDNSTVAGVNASSATISLLVQGTTTLNPFQVNSSTGISLLSVSANGSVGIGTTTNASTFFAQGTSTLPTLPIANFASSNGVSVLTVNGATPTTGVFIVNSSTGITMFSVNVDNTVGIGTTTLAAANLIVQGTSTQPTLDLFQIASSTGTNLFKVTNKGRVGINSSTPNYLFVVNGTAAMPGLTTSAGLQTGVVCVGAGGELINDSVACLASARRFKTDIKPLGAGLNEILQLNPVEYKWTKEFNRGFENDPNKNGVHYGLIADDVKRIDPLLVTVETSGPDKGKVHGLTDTGAWQGLFVQGFKDLDKKIQHAKRSAEEDWQWLVIGLLALGLVLQQRQINKLKK